MAGKIELPFNKGAKKEEEPVKERVPGAEQPVAEQPKEDEALKPEAPIPEIPVPKVPETQGKPEEPAIPAAPEAKAGEAPATGNLAVGEVPAAEPDEVIPSTEDLQQQLALARAGNQAILIAVDLGIDSKTIPYVIKLADFSAAVDAAGAVNPKALKAAIDKVLADIPALKPADQGAGFRQIGASDSQQPTNQNDLLSAAFGNNKK